MLAEWLAEAQRKAATRTGPAPEPRVELPYAGWLKVAGVDVWIGVARDRYAEVRARAVGQRVPRLIRRHHWTEPFCPPRADALDALPAIAPETHGDELAASALPALREAWIHLRWTDARTIVVSDGPEVVAWIDRPVSSTAIQAVADLVALTARWDAGLAAMLLALPDAQLLADRTMSPAVLVAPGDVRVGRRGDALVVELGDRTRRVDADPIRVLAAISALRAEAAAGTPYR